MLQVPPIAAAKCAPPRDPSTSKQLEILAEAFNLTNRANVVTRNTNFGARAYPVNPSATFGQITAVGEPRSFQFGGRVRF